MARRYHSASSDALGQRCHRAWYYRYVAKLRDPEFTWAQVADWRYDKARRAWVGPSGEVCPSRARSAALGTELHARIERWYAGVAVDWYDLPGQVALSGLHLLPAPNKVHAVHVESFIGRAPFAARGPEDPPTVLEVDGILWNGRRDLVVSAPGEFLRMGVDAPDGWLLVDHKSSSDIDRYALSPFDLASDYAANLYALATCQEKRIDSVPARWVYYETKDRRHAEPRDAVLRADVAFGVVRAGSARAKTLDTLRDEQDATPNPAACGDYGGCQFHVSAGGPCNAQRSLGALIQARVPKRENIMALPPNVAARFANVAPVDAPAPPPPDAAPQDGAGNAAPTDAPAAEPPKPRGRPPKAAAGTIAAGAETFNARVGEHAVTLTGHPSAILAVLRALEGGAA